MKKNVLDTNLSGKVAVVTGAGGILCSYFAKVLARAGAKVALLDLNDEAANMYAQEIIAEGGIAKAKRALITKVNESKGYSMLEITVVEGRNHLIKHMVSAIGSEVYKLNRKSFAGISIEGLAEGKYRELTPEELEKLK